MIFKRTERILFLQHCTSCHTSAHPPARVTAGVVTCSSKDARGPLRLGETQLDSSAAPASSPPPSTSTRHSLALRGRLSAHRECGLLAQPCIPQSCSYTHPFSCSCWPKLVASCLLTRRSLITALPFSYLSTTLPFLSSCRPSLHRSQRAQLTLVPLTLPFASRHFLLVLFVAPF